MEPLQEAVEAINEGFVLYDAEDRLVLCNSKYRQIYALSADAMVSGVRFADLLTFWHRAWAVPGGEVRS